MTDKIIRRFVLASDVDRKPVITTNGHDDNPIYSYPRPHYYDPYKHYDKKTQYDLWFYSAENDFGF